MKAKSESIISSVGPDDAKIIETPEPALEPEPQRAPHAAEAAPKKTVTLVLVGAGSFSGQGVKKIWKNQAFETDSQTAKSLLATGMLQKGA